MATTASASPTRLAAADHTVSKNRSTTPPHQDPSASQSVASTSSVTLDEPDTTSNTVTPSSQLKTARDGNDSLKEEEDEDARLLASLANDISKGISSTAASLVGLDESAIKAETLDAMPVDGQADGNFSSLAEDASGPIQAYAKLEFPGFSYYIQTLDCTIGRRPAHMRTPALRDGETQHITGAKKMEGDVDVDLGLLKSISRLHVRIFYQDQPRQNGDAYGNRDYEMEAGQSGSQGRFVLQVLGRNGCFVDDVPAEKDAIVPLGKRTKIQIAERVFYFVLPPAPLNKQYNSDGELGSDASLDDSEEDSGSLGSSEEEEEESSASSSSEEENESEERDEIYSEEKGTETKRRPKLVLKKKPVASATEGKGKGKGKGKHQGKTIWEGEGLPAKRRKEEDEIDDDDSDEAVEEMQVKKATGKGSSKKAKVAATAKEKPAEEKTSGRKRKRGSGAEQEQSTALKVGTPIGVETLSKPKKKKKVNGEIVEVVNEGSKAPPAATPGKGNGKGGGKAHIVAAALAAKAKVDEETGKALGSSSANTVNGKAMSTLSTSASNAAIRPMSGNPARPISGAPLPRPGDPSRPMQSYVRPASSGPSGSMSYNRLPGAAQVPRPIAGMQQAPSVRPLGVTSTSTSSAPFPPSSAAFAHLTSQNRPPPAASSQPLPPAGPGIKPDHSNIDLIREALSNPISLSRGGKLTLQEIYEDISSRHEWYRNNNRSNGRDWHSSIRHAVGNSKDMVRIPKKPNEQGKGVFYAFSGSEAAKAFRLEEQANGVLPGQAGTPASPTPPVVSAAAAVSTAPRPAPAAIALPSQQSAIPPSASDAARPSPPIQPNGRVSIVIGKAPASALAQHAALPKSAMTKNIEVIFKGPPIVHHEGTLYLNPVIFGHMSASEVNDIGGKGAQTALALLQGQLVKHLQTVMKPGQGASPRPARPPVAAASGSGTASSQTPRPAPQPANGLQASSAPRPPPVIANRPMQGRPGPPPPGAMQSPRPGAPVPTASPGFGRPTPAGTPVRPMSNGMPGPMLRPGAAPVPNRPQQPPGQSRPPVMANGQSIAPRPMPPSGQMPRPQISQGAAAAPGSQSQAIPVRPFAAPSSVVGQQRPVQRPLQMQPLARPASPSPRPPPAAPLSAVRPAPRSATSQSAATSSSNSSVPGATAAAAAAQPSSNAVMSAMSALASHPDAAGLMTLLSGGKVESGAKLTPGQLELLQRAGRIAAEKQKAQQQQQQQQKVESSPAPAPSPSPSPAPASQ